MVSLDCPVSGELGLGDDGVEVEGVADEGAADEGAAEEGMADDGSADVAGDVLPAGAAGSVAPQATRARPADSRPTPAAHRLS